MIIETKNFKDVNRAPYNPRIELKPGMPEYEKLKKSIEEFGHVLPMVFNKRSGNLCGGHQTMTVLEDLGITKAQMSIVDFDDVHEKACNIALNKIGGDWEGGKLSELLGELSALPDFDIELTGFDVDEIEGLGISLGGGGISPIEAKKTLAEKFIVPPFSIFDTRQGYWQDRKKAWVGLGLKSEMGRGDTLLIESKEMTTQNLNYYRNRSKAFTTEHELSDGTQLSEYTGTSIFDPVLCEVLYTWFNVAGGHIIDPFAGGSVRGIVAEYLKYKYHGMDLSAEQIKANQAQAKALNLTPDWQQGNSLTIDEEFKDVSADLIFTCPPYFDLEIYSDNPDDISNMSYEEFLKTYQSILSKTAGMLKDNRFACVVISDVRDKKGFYRDLVGATKSAFEDNGVKFYNEIILINVAGSLPMRVNKQFQAGRKVGRTHQNVLVFYKGDPKKIRSEFGTVVVPDDIEGHQE